MAQYSKLLSSGAWYTLLNEILSLDAEYDEELSVLKFGETESKEL